MLRRRYRCQRPISYSAYLSYPPRHRKRACSASAKSCEAWLNLKSNLRQVNRWRSSSITPSILFKLSCPVAPRHLLKPATRNPVTEQPGLERPKQNSPPEQLALSAPEDNAPATVPAPQQWSLRIKFCPKISWSEPTPKALNLSNSTNSVWHSASKGMTSSITNSTWMQPAHQRAATTAAGRDQAPRSSVMIKSSFLAGNWAMAYRISPAANSPDPSATLHLKIFSTIPSWWWKVVTIQGRGKKKTQQNFLDTQSLLAFWRTWFAWGDFKACLRSCLPTCVDSISNCTVHSSESWINIYLETTPFLAFHTWCKKILHQFIGSLSHSACTRLYTF